MQTQLMNDIASTSSRTEKERLLGGADKTTQLMLQYALDPYKTYGVTLDRSTVMYAVNMEPALETVQWWTGFQDILDQLAARTLTGGAATTQLMAHFRKCPSAEDAEWALRVLHKKLRCGVTAKTAMKIFPGIVSPFEVALAKAWEGKPLPGVGYVEPKLDGLRVTVVDGVARTRNGNEVSATSAMIDELGSYLSSRGSGLKDWVIDGEFIGSGTFEDTISKARASGDEDRGLVYNVFDMVHRDEWTAQDTRPFSDRRRDVMRHIQAGQLVQPVESVRVQDITPVQLKEFCDKWMADGYEGAMYKSDEPYRFKRSSAILKIKKWETEDTKLVGFEEGKGKYEGLLGAIVVQLDDGTKVNVGTGFTDGQREAIWDNRQKLLGKTAEIQYQNKTSKGSLRFPVFVRFRDDK